MRQSLHTDDEIAFLLKEAESGIAITEICAAAHVSVGTFYRWRRRLGGLPPAGVARLARIERENVMLHAEVSRLREALRQAYPLKPAVDARRTPLPATDPRHAPPVRFRGAEASVGRFAFERSAN